MKLHDDAITTDTLSATFAALADPTRRAILARLTGGPATVNELAAPFAVSLPTVSRHLKVLEAAGLVVKERSAQFRPCRLEVAPLEAANAWLDQYRSFFAERFDRLGAQLEAMMAQRAEAGAPPPATKPPPSRQGDD
jgi:DNA-binding transcriptional ArsR family regulator